MVLNKDEFIKLPDHDINDKTPRIVSGMNKPLDLKPLGLRGRAVFRQILMVTLGNLSILTSGMALALPAVTLSQLTDRDEPVWLTEAQGSWFASMNTVACPIGGLLVGYCLDKIGRKNTLFVVNVSSIISWGIMALAIYDTNEPFFIQLMVARFIIGVTTGLSSSPANVYSAEISHPNIRGRLILGSSLAIASGILVMYILGYFIRDDWRLISVICCSYSIVTTVLMLPMPESPMWLLTKGRVDEARESLKYFRGLLKNDNYVYDEFESEFSQMRKTSQNVDGHKPPLKQLIKEPEVYKPLLIMIGFFAFQQFSGIFVVIVYAVQIAIEAGVTIDPILCAIFIGLARLVTTALMGPVLDRWGRRPPALFSGFGMTICMFLLAANSWFPSMNIPYLPVTCIIIYIITSTLGLMTLPFSMIAEVYPQRARGQAAGFTICCGLFMGFVVIKLYPTMVEGMGNENVFAFYGTVSFFAILYLYFFLPETKGKTLLEIEEEFRYGKQARRDKELEVELKDIYVKDMN